MRDIFLLVGKSATGKDFILNELTKQEGWKKMVSYTTRPKRPKEVDGYDYHFLKSNYEFEHLVYKGEMFEKTEYQTMTGLWLYGFGNKSVNENCVNVAIVNPDGVRQLAESSIKDRLYIVYITTEDELQRLQMYGSRLGRSMTIEEKSEAFDRLLRDLKDFNQFELDISYANSDEGGLFYYKDTGIPVVVCDNDYTDIGLSYIVGTINDEYEVINE